MENDDLKDSVMQDIVLMKYTGMQPVVVHGGGTKISEWMQRIGKDAEFVQGLRVTDQETVEVAEMVLAGSINKEIVSLINAHGGRAVGFAARTPISFERGSILRTWSTNLAKQRTSIWASSGTSRMSIPASLYRLIGMVTSQLLRRTASERMVARTISMRTRWRARLRRHSRRKS